MNGHYTKRLSRDTTYKKPAKTFQETLSPDEIKKKLEDYKQINEIDGLPLNTHIRYFITNMTTGKKQFRLGGYLTKIDKEYIVLSNGNFSWSVQKKNTIFFYKMAFDDIKEEIIRKVSKKYEKQFTELIAENEKLKNTLREIKRNIRKKSK